MLFESWDGIARVVVIGTMAYAALVLLLRISGKRTLTKLNAFDLVVTVALGSTLATVLLDNSIPLAEGVTALALLVCLQFAITWTSVRVPSVQRAVKAEPRLLLRDGRLLADAMRAERITRDEVLAGLRNNGLSDPSEAAAVILETDGSLSVLRQVEQGAALVPVTGGRARADEPLGDRT